jgi:hypothetical protein
MLGTGHSNMNDKKLERAIELGKRVEHFFLALVGAHGFPYVNSARQIEQVSDNQFAIEDMDLPADRETFEREPENGCSHL